MATSPLTVLEAVQRNSINEHRRVVVGIVGEVSAGKSTLLNAFLASTLSGTQMRCTTMAPTVYLEEEPGGGSKKAMPQNDVLAMVQQRDSAMYERGGDAISVSETAMAFVVPPVKDIGKRSDGDVKYAFVDVPGLNDSTTVCSLRTQGITPLPCIVTPDGAIQDASPKQTLNKSSTFNERYAVSGLRELPPCHA